MTSVELWIREQSDVGRSLGLLQHEVDAFHRGEQPDYELMHEVVSLLVSYTDRLHQPVQTVAFERLLRRDPALTPIVNRLCQEHLMIAASGADLLERLREIAADALMPRGVVEQAAATYLVYFRHHIAVEERALLPRAGRLLDDGDWQAVRAAVPVKAAMQSPDELVASLRALQRRYDSRTGPGPTLR